MFWVADQPFQCHITSSSWGFLLHIAIPSCDVRNGRYFGIFLGGWHVTASGPSPCVPWVPWRYQSIRLQDHIGRSGSVTVREAKGLKERVALRAAEKSDASRTQNQTRDTRFLGASRPAGVPHMEYGHIAYAWGYWEKYRIIFPSAPASSCLYR